MHTFVQKEKIISFGMHNWTSPKQNTNKDECIPWAAGNIAEALFVDLG